MNWIDWLALVIGVIWLLFIYPGWAAASPAEQPR